MRSRSFIIPVGVGIVLAMPAAARADIGEAVGGMFSVLFFFAFLAVVVAAIVWFFRGPAKRANEYVELLAGQIQNPDDRLLFTQLYRNKGPKDVIVAWFLNLLLSPTIAYLYLAKWGLAVISLLTFEGVGFWWLFNIFSMPSQVAALNKSLADQAITELRLARPGLVPITNVGFVAPATTAIENA